MFPSLGIRRVDGRHAKRRDAGHRNGGIDAYGFGNFGEQVWRDGNLRTNLPFAARFYGELFRLLGDGRRRHVTALSEESGEAQHEDGRGQNHKISAAERACGVEASEMEQIAAVVNLRRLAPVQMNN
jgi:hypothetical protein